MRRRKGFGVSEEEKKRRNIDKDEERRMNTVGEEDWGEED